MLQLYHNLLDWNMRNINSESLLNSLRGFGSDFMSKSDNYYVQSTLSHLAGCATVYHCKALYQVSTAKQNSQAKYSAFFYHATLAAVNACVLYQAAYNIPLTLLIYAPWVLLASIFSADVRSDPSKLLWLPLTLSMTSSLWYSSINITGIEAVKIFATSAVCIGLKREYITETRDQLNEMTRTTLRELNVNIDVDVGFAYAATHLILTYGIISILFVILTDGAYNYTQNSLYGCLRAMRISPLVGQDVPNKWPEIVSSAAMLLYSFYVGNMSGYCTMIALRYFIEANSILMKDNDNIREVAKELFWALPVVKTAEQIYDAYASSGAGQ